MLDGLCSSSRCSRCEHSSMTLCSFCDPVPFVIPSPVDLPAAASAFVRIRCKLHYLTFCLSPLHSNPAGICWSGTGSGAFTAESFQISSHSACQNYVSAMLEGHTRRRALGDGSIEAPNSTRGRSLQSSSGGSSGRAANVLTNRRSGNIAPPNRNPPSLLTNTCT